MTLIMMTQTPLFLSGSTKNVKKLEKPKALKQELNEELLLVVWHPLRWWDWWLSEDDCQNKKNKKKKLNQLLLINLRSVKC